MNGQEAKEPVDEPLNQCRLLDTRCTKTFCSNLPDPRKFFIITFSRLNRSSVINDIVLYRANVR